MKRMTALLVTAMLGLSPAIAFAQNAPSNDTSRNDTSNDTEVDTFVWSAGQAHLGLMVMGLTPELRSYFGAPRDAGLLVARVEPNSPAARAGIRVGDLLVSVGSRRVQGAADVLNALSSTNSSRVPIEIIRQGKPLALQATLPQPPNAPMNENPTI
jgi:membrane-associated protease RseP (regulator of RpoE activity)